MTQHEQHQQQQDRPGTANLRARRKALGLTRADLAVKAACSVGTIDLIEKGVTRRGIIRDKIARVLAELEAA